MNNNLGIIVFGHRLLIEVDKDEEVTTKGGIILTPTMTKQNLEQYLSGKVLQVGSTAFSFLIDEEAQLDHRPDVLNKRVLFKKRAGIDVVKNGGHDNVNASKYRIVNDEDVMAVFTEDNQEDSK